MLPLTPILDTRASLRDLLIVRLAIQPVILATGAVFTGLLMVITLKRMMNKLKYPIELSDEGDIK